MKPIKSILNKYFMNSFFQPFWLKLKYAKKKRNASKFTVDDTKQMAFYRQFINPGELVFDVGANIGDRSRLFLGLNANVVAFEPQQLCIEVLESVFNCHQNFTLVKKALGRKEGKGQMLISNESKISTLSKEWVNNTKKSGRFANYQWNNKQTVQISTLDKIIQERGIPSFVKIDVEGYEFEVLSGLSRPIKCISIEFAAEEIENAYKCIEYIDALSSVEFQISKGESLTFEIESWVTKSEILKILSQLICENKLVWGDIYIRDDKLNS